MVTSSVDPERREVVEDERRQVVACRRPTRSRRELAASIHGGSPRSRIFARVRPRGVEDRAAGAVDRPGVVPVERAEVVGVGAGAGPDVGQALPAAADADDVVADLGGAVDDALDDGVEAGDVAAAGQDPDPLHLGHRRES